MSRGIGIHKAVAVACLVLLAAMLVLFRKAPSLDAEMKSRGDAPVAPDSDYARALFDRRVGTDVIGAMSTKAALQLALRFDDAKRLDPFIRQRMLWHLLGEPVPTVNATVKEAIEMGTGGEEPLPALSSRAAKAIALTIAASTGKEQLSPASNPHFYDGYEYRGQSVWTKEPYGILVRADVWNLGARTITGFLVHFTVPVPSGKPTSLYCQAGNYLYVPMKELRPGESFRANCQVDAPVERPTFLALADRAVKEQTRFYPERGQIFYAEPEIVADVWQGMLSPKPGIELIAKSKRLAADEASKAGCQATGTCELLTIAAISRTITGNPLASLAVAGFLMGGIIRGMRPGRASKLLAFVIPGAIFLTGVAYLMQHGVLAVLIGGVLYGQWFLVWLAGFWGAMLLLGLVPRGDVISDGRNAA